MRSNETLTYLSVTCFTVVVHTDIYYQILIQSTNGQVYNYKNILSFFGFHHINNSHFFSLLTYVRKKEKKLSHTCLLRWINNTFSCLHLTLAWTSGWTFFPWNASCFRRLRNTTGRTWRGAFSSGFSCNFGRVRKTLCNSCSEGWTHPICVYSLFSFHIWSVRCRTPSMLRRSPGKWYLHCCM